jgi:Transposase and inactivated derivatives
MRTVYQLKPRELAEIEKAMRQDKRAEVRQRATVIRLLHLGHKPKAVAEQHMVSVATIYNWHKLWREQGIEGLANRKKTGRPSKATEAYCRKLEEVLAKEPAEYGYRFAIWTSDRLRAHLEKETDILLSESRFRALLKKRGYRYRRPKHDLSHLQDEKAKKKAEKLLEEMKKTASQTISNSSLWTK